MLSRFDMIGSYFFEGRKHGDFDINLRNLFGANRREPGIFERSAPGAPSNHFDESFPRGELADASPEARAAVQSHECSAGPAKRVTYRKVGGRIAALDGAGACAPGNFQKQFLLAISE
jgi:hypothetical protein